MLNILFVYHVYLHPIIGRNVAFMYCSCSVYCTKSYVIQGFSLVSDFPFVYVREMSITLMSLFLVYWHRIKIYSEMHFEHTNSPSKVDLFHINWEHSASDSQKLHLARYICERSSTMYPLSKHLMNDHTFLVGPTQCLLFYLPGFLSVEAGTFIRELNWLSQISDTDVMRNIINFRDTL